MRKVGCRQKPWWSGQGSSSQRCVGFVVYLETERREEDKNIIVVAVIFTAKDAAVDAKADEKET